MQHITSTWIPFAEAGTTAGDPRRELPPGTAS
jgi:hypothetical protein